MTRRRSWLLACGAPLLLLASPTRAETVDLSELPAVVGASEGMLLGRRLAVADLDGVAGPDLVLGSVEPWVHVLRNRFTAPWPTAELPVPAGESEDWLVIDGSGRLGFGLELAVGDLNGDGAADLIVSSFLETRPLDEVDSPNVGAVYVFPGPLDAASLEADDAQTIFVGDRAQGLLGAALAAADFDGDGIDDLVIGQPGFSGDPAVLSLEGRALFFAGGATFASPGVLTPSDADAAWRGGAAFQALGARLDKLRVGDAEVDDPPQLAIQFGGDTALLQPPAFDDSLPDEALPSSEGEGRLGTLIGLRPPIASPEPRHELAGIWLGTQPTALPDAGAILRFPPDLDWFEGVDASQAALRIEGLGGEDGSLGDHLLVGDVDGDLVEDLFLSSPGWSDGVSQPPDTLDEAVGLRAGAAYLLDGCHLVNPGGGGDCINAPEGTLSIDAVDWVQLHGRQLGAGMSADAGDESAMRLALAGDRLIVARPRTSHPIYGEDVGALHVVDLDADDDGSPWMLDCDDADPARYPGNPEACDGADNDCDGVLDPAELDADLDGQRVCAGDCDDASPDVFDGHPEVACNGVDDDCDGALHPSSLDDDGDGYTECGRPCDQDPALRCDVDCDDLVFDRHPGAPETCNGGDEDCDGTIDEGFDGDGDGFVDAERCDGLPQHGLDCDDEDPTVYPGAPDGPDALDRDCVPDEPPPPGCTCSSSGSAGWLAALLLLPFRRARRRRSASGVGRRRSAIGVGRRRSAIGVGRRRSAIGVGRRKSAIGAPPRPPASPRIPARAASLAFAVVPLGELPVLALGDGDLALGEHAAVLDRPAGPTLVLGSPDRTVDHANSGGVLWLEPDAPLPAAIDGGDLLCGGGSSSQRVGSALAVGDVDGDDVEDLILGARAQDKVLAFPGAELPPAPNEPCDAHFSSSAPNLFREVGNSLAVADLNLDGFDDVLAGEIGVLWVGRVLIDYGGADFFDTPPSTAALTGDVTNEFFILGTAVSAVDWTCDGLPDVASGGLGTNLHVVLNPLTPDPPLDPLDPQPPAIPLGEPWTAAEVNDSNAVTIQGGFVDANLSVQQLGDVTGNGCRDVLLGVPGWGQRGAVAIVEGDPSLVSDVGLDELAWLMLEGDSAGDRAGQAVRAVRWTEAAQTGRPDLLVGAPGAAEGEAADRGLVAFLPSDRIPWPDGGPGDDDDSAEGPPADTVGEAAGWTAVGSLPADRFGDELLVWRDLDGDARPDVVAFAPGFRAPNVDDEASPRPGGAFAIHSRWFLDGDGDGAFAIDDCDDADPDRSPSAAEVCDGLDTDCDGQTDAPDPLGAQPFHADLDGDGFPGALVAQACAAPPGTIPAGDPDCDDQRADVYPGAPELCDGLGNACAQTPPDELDADGDGFSPCAGDCDDSRSDVSPTVGQEALCDGVDEDCDGAIDEDFDADGDGFVSGEDCGDFHDQLDCNDAAPAAHPGAVELPGNNIDEDCDGADGAPQRVDCTCSHGAPAPAWGLLLVALARRRR